MWSLELVSKLVTTTLCSSHYNWHLMAGHLAPASEVAIGHTLPFLKRSRSANFKMVGNVLLRPLRPKLDGQDEVQVIVTRALNCSH
jgi:hypothetical protein